ncbi:hypothetical protein AMK59_6623 [Oryctes borbonicus]|uniref:Uncharacterized protein n=1 Tax=Oryctes borbonicus TaxID=1629725 RepID=A0A0T6AVK9_9SCAR|nr:hypothetical protein AMK59_6623 [Oryctes borbonicus]
MALFTRNWKDIEIDLFNDEGIETLTSVEQINVESNIKRLYQSLGSRCRVDNSLPKLITAAHEKYLKQCLTYLPAGYVVIYCICKSILTRCLYTRILEFRRKSYLDVLLDCS